ISSSTDIGMTAGPAEKLRTRWTIDIVAPGNAKAATPAQHYISLRALRALRSNRDQMQVQDVGVAGLNRREQRARRRAVEVDPRGDRVLELAGCVFRLVREDVEADADIALADRPFERGLIDDLRARGVDDNRSRLQPVEHRRADQAFRVGCERKMHAEHVTAS